MSYKEQAEAVYIQKYKGRGIPPRIAGNLKEVIAKALKKGEKVDVAARAYLKEKGVTMTDAPEPKDEAPAKKRGRPPGSKSEEVEEAPKRRGRPPGVKTKAKVAEKASEEESAEEEEAQPKKSKKSKTSKETKVETLPAMDPSKMDKGSLRSSLEELRRAKVPGTEWSKSDSVEELARKLHCALAVMTTPEGIRELQHIDPAKLAKMDRDCLGLYIDMRTPLCAQCPQQFDCVKAYLSNVKDGFSAFKAAKKELEVEEAAEAVTDDDVPAKKSSKKSKTVKGAWKFDANEPIQVCDVKNLQQKGGDAYEVLDAILGEDFPETLGELRGICEVVYDYDSDEAFMKYAGQLRKCGIIVRMKQTDGDDWVAY